MKLGTPHGEITLIVGKKIKVISHYHPGLLAEIKALKGAKWRPEDKTWEVTDCRRNWMQFEILSGTRPPEFEPYYADLSEVEPQLPLYPYQRPMSNFQLTRKRCILAAEQGTGKSITTLATMKEVGGTWLWVGPSKTLAAIELEMEKWGVECKTLSYAMLRQGKTSPKGLTGVVFDESSRLKNSGTKTWRAARKLAKDLEYVLLLSGKPAPNDQSDWWAQAELCCPGWLRESTQTKLQDRLAIKVPAEFGEFQKIIGWKEDEIERLGRRLRRLCMVVRSCDVQDLPSIRYHRVRIHVEPLTKELAKAVAMQAENPLVALRQISDGFRYLHGTVERWGAPKEPALRQILWDAEESGRVVVWAGFRESIDQAVRVCQEEGWLVLRCDGRGYKPEAGFTTKDMLREMDINTVHRLEKVAFVGHPKSGGMGLTLTAATKMVFVSQDFSAESRTQAVKRCNRDGSVEDLDVYDLIHLGVDEMIVDRIEKKLDMGEVTLEEILRYLDN